MLSHSIRKLITYLCFIRCRTEISYASLHSLLIYSCESFIPFNKVRLFPYKCTHTSAHTRVAQRNERIQIMKRNGRIQTNKQTIKSIQCVHWEQSSMFFVTAPCMYRITHGASSILKLNANMWLNIKAIDFMRGLKRKFVRSVDSFKLNANAECQCWYFGCCCCCFGLHNSQDCQIQIQHCLFGFIETKIFGRHTCRRILLMSLSLCISSARSFQTGIHPK